MDNSSAKTFLDCTNMNIDESVENSKVPTGMGRLMIIIPCLLLINNGHQQLMARQYQ
jgi:hypothetical protein